LRQSLQAARELKEAIRCERNLTASIGVASNKLLAKLASDFQKPDGLTLITEAEKIQFLRPLPVRGIYGVGKVTAEQLNRAGINTVGDLQDHPGDLRAFVGSFGPTLKGFAFGEDDRPLDLSDEVKSISTENTFLQDTEDRQILRTTLREQAAEIASELQKKDLAALTIQVRLRYGDFTTLTRQMTLPDPISDARGIFRHGCVLLARHRLVTRPLRLIVHRFSNTFTDAKQLKG
jgi:DNA polymerase-4